MEVPPEPPPEPPTGGPRGKIGLAARRCIEEEESLPPMPTCGWADKGVCEVISGALPPW